MTQQQLERKFSFNDKVNSGMIDRRIAQLETIPKGYKVKCTVCKDYRYVASLCIFKGSQTPKNYVCGECKER